MKKLFLLISTLILTVYLVFVLTSCSCANESNYDKKIKEIYGYYVVYAESLGEEVLSYEDWLASIKGEDGLTPSIVIGENGNWFINDVDTKVPATATPVESYLSYYLLDDGTLGVAGHTLPVYDGDDDEQDCRYPINYTVTQLVIPEKVANKTVTKIMPWAFNNYITLEKIQLPETITELGNNSFQNCHKLTELNLPENVVNLGKNCFLNCTSLNIKTTTYEKCEYIGTADNPYKFLVKTVYNESDKVYTLHENCEVMLSRCIDDNTITTIYLPEGLKKINEEAFYNYSGLTDVYYKCKLTKWGSSFLEAVINISKNVDNKAFTGRSTNIKRIYYLNDNNEYECSGPYNVYSTLVQIGFFN